MSSLVSIGLVTWNSAAYVAECIAAIRRQVHPDIELVVIDNGSTDDTWRILMGCTDASERQLRDQNLGFSGAHNKAIAATSGTYYLSLNPDVRLGLDFVARLVETMESMPRCGSASGKLLRTTPRSCIDSTGVYVVPSQRHLDRGSGEMDRGQYDRRELVFGVSGAAGFYRRAMLDDVAVAGEIFDEAFFAYREDVDLAWRAQLLGWSSVYEPRATATHQRRVTPERRHLLPASINRMSVRNRFLLRIKNQTPSQALRFALPTLWRDAQVIGYTLVREHGSLPGLVDVLRLLPPMLRKRRVIMRRRRTPIRELNRWFGERSRPA